MNNCISSDLVRYDVKGNMYLIKGELVNGHYFVEEIFKDNEGQLVLSGIEHYIKDSNLFHKKIVPVSDYNLEELRNDEDALNRRLYELRKQIGNQNLIMRSNELHIKQSALFLETPLETQEQLAKYISGNFEYIVKGIYVWSKDKSIFDNKLKAIAFGRSFDGEYQIMMGEYSNTSGKFTNGVYFATEKQDAVDKLIENFNNLKHKSFHEYKTVIKHIEELGIDIPEKFNEEYKQCQKKEYKLSIDEYNKRIKEYKDKLENL